MEEEVRKKEEKKCEKYNNINKEASKGKNEEKAKTARKYHKDKKYKNRKTRTQEQT